MAFASSYTCAIVLLNPASRGGSQFPLPASVSSAEMRIEPAGQRQVERAFLLPFLIRHAYCVSSCPARSRIRRECTVGPIIDNTLALQRRSSLNPVCPGRPNVELGRPRHPLTRTARPTGRCSKRNTRSWEKLPGCPVPGNTNHSHCLIGHVDISVKINRPRARSPRMKNVCPERTHNLRGRLARMDSSGSRSTPRTRTGKCQKNLRGGQSVGPPPGD